MEEFFSFFKVKRNLINLLILLILVVGLPWAVNLVKQQQILKSRADAADVEFVDGTCISTRNGTKVATCKEITLKFTSPYGIGSATTVTVSPTPAPAASSTTTGSGTTGTSTQASTGTQTGSSTVRTCKGETKTWAQICSELQGAHYNRACVPGDAVALKDYDEAACPGPAAVPAGTICENDPPQAVSVLQQNGSKLFEQVHWVADCTKFCPNNDAPDRGGCPTNPGTDYAVSRKDSAWCWGFDSKGTNRCLQLQNGRACTLGMFDDSSALSNSCMQCIANQRPDIAVAYNGPFGQGSCSLRRQINDWCLKVDTNSCNSLRSGSGACAAACGQGQTSSISIPSLVTTVYAQANNGGGRSDCFMEGNQCTYIDYDGCDGDPMDGAHDYCWHDCAANECGGETPPPPAPNPPPPPAPNPPPPPSSCTGVGCSTACSNNPPQTPHGSNQTWVADCSSTCSNNAGCPKNTTQPGSIDPNTSAWCYQFSNGTHCLQLRSGAGGGTTPPPPPPPGGTTPPPPPPPGTTGGPTFFRFAENPTALAAATWQTYSTAPTSVAYTFADSSSGKLFVYAEFKNAAGQITAKTVNINFVGSNPALTGLSCNLETTQDPNDPNKTIGVIKFNITGTGFGTTKGTSKITANTTEATINDWKDATIQAQVPNPSSGTQNFTVTLNRSDGAPAVSKDCALGLSQVSLGAALFCHAPNQKALTNVAVAIAETGSIGVGSTTPTTTPKAVKEIVSVDNNGILQGLKTRLQDGKKYRLSLKVPKSVRVVTPDFNGSSGTTVVPNFTLPVGDIFPLDNPDGKINNFDKAELNRQWIVASSQTGRSGDFNGDGRVNSIDWACMRESFNKEDAPDLK